MVTTVTHGDRKQHLTTDISADALVKLASSSLECSWNNDDIVSHYKEVLFKCLKQSVMLDDGSFHLL